MRSQFLLLYVCYVDFCSHYVNIIYPVLCNDVPDIGPVSNVTCVTGKVDILSPCQVEVKFSNSSKYILNLVYCYLF